MISKAVELGSDAAIVWTDYQLDAFRMAASQPDTEQRLCLYYKTGAGKTYTALGCMAVWGHDENITVVAPPSTHASWEAAGDRLGIQLSCMSHAKFRMKSTKLSRHTALIIDEFHLLGGHKGLGWKKLDTMARGLQAPLVIASATPNYNDAERVYCIQHVLDPHSCKGGYLQFLYTHCETKANPFGQEPKVTGFRNYASAEEYLAALPKMAYLPDDLVYSIVDIPIPWVLPDELLRYGFDRRKGRVIASQIEERHTSVFLSLVDDDGLIRPHVYEELVHLSGQASTPLLVYANHSTVADALGRTLAEHGAEFAVVTGKTPKRMKDAVIQRFRDGELDILVGTASLATGTDGLDKVCDMLVILDDTDDDSLRRQLIGRIMPRGLGQLDASKKQVYRLQL